jgi:hypothetical protein
MPKPWITRRRATALVFGAALIGSSAAACSRSAPASFPTGSAASLDAAEAPAARVGAVLAGDPPLPGEPTAGWPGLDDARSGDAPGAGEHHHHHHGAPAPLQATPDGGTHDGHAH